MKITKTQKETITKKEIEDFYNNCPEDMEVLETKYFNIELLRYETIELQYI